MELTWLGTAGFIVKTKEAEIVFDPFLSRGQGEASPFSVESFANAKALFVGHGHFDHTYDIPQIAANADVKVFAPGLTGNLLRLRGLKKEQFLLAHNKEVLFAPLKVRAFHSAHAVFDWPLVASTIQRCGVKGCLSTLHLGLAYPKGLVQTYLFESKGKKVLFISSAGCREEELKKYRNLEIDILLAPLQGHSQIQDLVAKQTVVIQPKIVIPHHHDDFYPPLSQNISVSLFEDKLKHYGFSGDLLEIPLFGSRQIF